MCLPPPFSAASLIRRLGGILVLGKNKQLWQQKKGGITAIRFKPSVFKIVCGDQPCNPHEGTHLKPWEATASLEV